MAKLKETKAAYSAEPITVVTTRGTTEIPRALRQRYRVTAMSRLRWMDTGHGLLIVPVEKKTKKTNNKPQIQNRLTNPLRQSREWAIKNFLPGWMHG
jgi:bifunctional DNA-binding transcriptional regulator/antitoxin component of YhaV-PrlF toxin-antitoxin module